MNSSETTFSLWSCLFSMRFTSWSLTCTLCRISGTAILMISIFCFIFDIRFLFTKRCQNGLVISLFLASLLVITLSVPGVFVQLTTCHRHCFAPYCRLEGFCSYFSGCLCMLVFMSLSIHRYLSLCSYNHLLSYRCLTLLSWLVSIGFTFPLLFDYFNSYVPEGLGFHCSINWRDQSKIGRIYILLTFILMYFLPLTILLLVNIQAHFIVRNVYSKHNLDSYFPERVQSRSSIRRSFPIIDFQKDYIYKYCVRKASDRRRFRADYRFLRAIIFMVSTYLIAWTPYSIIAILQLLNVKFIFDNAFLITLSAFIAKLSVIVTPMVYLSIMSYNVFKKILFK